MACNFALNLDKNDYQNIALDQDTVAVPAIFVATDEIDAKVLGNLLQAIRVDVKSFKSSHPVLYDLPDDHFEQGFVLPGFDVEKNIEE